MNQSTQKNGNHRLERWLRSPLGTFLAAQERRVVAESLEDVFGLELVQIGHWGESRDFFTQARTQKQTVIASTPRTGADVCCRSSQLAVASDSIDAVLLPHTLEFDPQPHAVLREVGRILVGEGQLLVLGFNPMGAWAMRHHLSVMGFPPGLARLISERRLRDWLALLGFEVTAARPYLFRLPVAPRRAGTDGASYEGPAHQHWSGFANAYLLKARKRVYTMTLIKPRWRDKRALVGGLVEPTSRSNAARFSPLPRSGRGCAEGS